jgi:hypothetical protein
MAKRKKIDCVEAFIKQTRKDYSKWDIEFPWFRGEPLLKQADALMPKLYRQGAGYGGYPLENRLLQYFRMKAPSLGYGDMPHREHTDQWLFFAQHVGLPTRLLDWTEGSLIALYFALKEERPVIWMLNPFELNRLTEQKDERTYNIYPITWIRHLGSANIFAAWGNDEGNTDLPIAVQPTCIHARMTAQRSVFTVHGEKKRSLCKLLAGKDILKKYFIDGRKRKEMLDELRILGVSHATLFPDPDGLAKDLTKLFRPDLVKYVEMV